MEVLERLDLRGDESVLDAGCGSGRVTAELAKRLPGGSILAVDASEAMIAKARENGRLVAQCGGMGNIAEHAAAIGAVAARAEFAPHFEGMELMWNFAEAVLERSDLPLTLEYIRLNIEASSPGAP
jgi:SAM-dependent methyltransferase